MCGDLNKTEFISIYVYIYIYIQQRQPQREKSETRVANLRRHLSDAQLTGYLTKNVVNLIIATCSEYRNTKRIYNKSSY